MLSQVSWGRGSPADAFVGCNLFCLRNLQRKEVKLCKNGWH